MPFTDGDIVVYGPPERLYSECRPNLDVVQESAAVLRAYRIVRCWWAPEICGQVLQMGSIQPLEGGSCSEFYLWPYQETTG